MTTQELKEYINKVLGNSIRCLLPSYWWKKILGLVVDKIDEVDSKFDDITITSDTSMSDSSTNPVQNKVIKAYVDNSKVTVDSSMSSSSTSPVQNKVIYSELAKKHNTLVSGTNIKTINGNTLLGSGDMEISEAPSVIVTNENVFDFFLSFGSYNKSSKARGFILRSTDSEECLAEIDNINSYQDSDGNLIWVIEYNYKDKRYRRLYNKTSESFIREEEIPLGDSLMLPIYIPVGYTLSEEEIAANVLAYNEYHSDTNKKLSYAIVRLLHEGVSASIPMSILNWYGDTFTIGDWDSGSNYDTFALTLSADGSITNGYLRKADDSLNDASTQPVQNKVIKAYVDGLVGDINTILDSINGEEI